jgi:hypothetical protein
MKPSLPTWKLPKAGTLFVTLFFVAAYCGMRSLPVEPCDFLHNQDTLGDSEGLEYCGPGESSFIDLDKIKFPLRAQVTPMDAPTAGQPCRFRLTLHNYKEESLTASDITLSHTRKVHLLCVDESLDDYQHVHPEEDPNQPGIFNFTLTPRAGGTYKVFLDFIIQRSGARVLLHDTFLVRGKSNRPDPSVAYEKQVGDYTFALQMPTNEIPSRQFQTVDFKVWNTVTGEPIALEPVMGAYAHLVAFDGQRRGFAHFHPLNQENTVPNSIKSALQFSFSLESPGPYRIWAQVKIDGREIFVPYNLTVI